LQALIVEMRDEFADYVMLDFDQRRRQQPRKRSSPRASATLLF